MNTQTILAADLQVGDRIYTPPTEALQMDMNTMKSQRITIPYRWLTVESVEVVRRMVRVTGPQSRRKYKVTQDLNPNAKVEVAR
jgi:hypothetical protein